MTQQTPLPYALRFCAIARITHDRTGGYSDCFLPGFQLQQLVESIESIHLENNRLKIELESLQTPKGCSVHDALSCMMSGQSMRLTDNEMIYFDMELEENQIGESIRINPTNPKTSIAENRMHLSSFLDTYKSNRFTPYTGEQK